MFDSLRGTLRRLRGLLLLVLIVTGAFARPAAAVPTDRLIVFGDSLSDTGNVFALYGLPPPPYVDGRWTNGPVWVDVVAERLGAAPPLPSETGGTNYAYGGATTGDGSFLGLLNMAAQVDEYLALGPPPAAGDLFVLLGGANDFFDGEPDASVPVGNLVQQITDLHTAGAERFLVANLPPLGQTPDNLGTPQEAVLDALTGEFNALYDAALDGLESSLGITVHRVDLAALFDAFLEAPGAFGFTNVTDPAQVGGVVVPNPDEYLFWDGVHPTRVAHAVTGEEAALVVGVPGDVDGDGSVGFGDLLAVLAGWGACGSPCPEDVDGDGAVGFGDVLVVLSAWSA